MTAPHTGPVVQAPDVADAVAAMRERGLRVSSVRRLMLDALYGSNEPMTADRLADQVGGQTGTDVASIYRNLELLEEIGLVRHFHLSHSPGLYVRAGGGLHEYLVCDSCRTVRRRRPARTRRAAQHAATAVRLGGALHPRPDRRACARRARARRQAR